MLHECRWCGELLSNNRKYCDDFCRKRMKAALPLWAEKSGTAKTHYISDGWHWHVEHVHIMTAIAKGIYFTYGLRYPDAWIVHGWEKKKFLHG